MEQKGESMRIRNIFLCAALSILLIAGNAIAAGYTQTKYPIVLVPGVSGFDKLIGTIDYWYRIPEALKKDGAIVESAAVTGWNSVEMRGEELIKFIEHVMDKYGCDKVNLIGHSHGATTARYAMYHMPEHIASLTTIAGPHQGTPTADFANDGIPNPTIQEVVRLISFTGINLVFGDFVALLSGHTEFIGQNDTAKTVAHFTKEGIASFNATYPCAGVPAGSTIGSYGDDANTSEGAYWGDGRGNALNKGDEGAIRYWSWTGNIGHSGITNILDPLEFVTIATNLFNEGYGYYGNADGFIPVSSAHFGQVIYDNYKWNHLDEINQSLGIIRPFAANPVSVFRQHANRIQAENL